GRFGQRMYEESALRVARDNEPADRLEILARLLLVPGGAAGRELLQPELIVVLVARNAASMARPLREEDRLNPGLEEAVVERRPGRSGRLRLLGDRGPGPCEEHQHARCRQQGGNRRLRNALILHEQGPPAAPSRRCAEDTSTASFRSSGI